MYDSFNTGFSGDGIRTSGARAGSVGGLATLGGLGGVGVAAGATVGALAAPESPVEGAAIGGAIGGVAGVAALPAFGAASRGIGNLANRGIESTSFGFRSGRTQAAIKNTARKAATKGAASAGSVLSAQVNAAGNVSMASRLNPLQRYSNLGSRLANKMGTYTPGGPVAEGGKIVRKRGTFKASGLAKGIIGAGALAVGAKGALDGIEQSRMGQTTPHTYSSTPTPQAMPTQPQFNPHDHAGATGDLVFAMNANRRG